MAATAVYARLAPVPLGPNPNHVGEGKDFQNIAATTSPFTVTIGGLYMFNVKGSTFGTVALHVLLPDDATYAAVDIMTGTATVTAGTVQGVATSFAADGTGLVYLSAGRYKIVIA